MNLFLTLVILILTLVILILTLVILICVLTSEQFCFICAVCALFVSQLQP
jgi:hypothetical protein